jgi:Tfp pilus assembly protein PilF
LQLPSEHHIDLEDHAASDANKDRDAEEFYRAMVEANPCNSLVLRNYAEFLYQVRSVNLSLYFIISSFR